jgi:Fic family protein
VTTAAVAHAQFETIHPFADGNGRIGRALVGWILVRRLAVPVPPPVSVALARDVGGYLSGLTLFRQGDADRWISWFAGAVERSANLTSAILDQVGELQQGWRGHVDDLRADATARRLVEDLPAHPAVTVALVAEHQGVSDAAARAAIAVLAERGILTPVLPVARSRPGRRPHWYVAHELLALLGG